jgi:GNAT superfamily N-acetyltransferase
MNSVQFKKDEFFISTDRTLIQFNVVHDYLSKESYWAQGRSAEIVSKSINCSLCFGLYKNSQQIGFARVITDYSVFAYILDLFIIKDYQRQGLGKWLMSCIMMHPDLQGKLKWVLSTRDAHGLYEKFHFSKLEYPENWMEFNQRKQ